MSVQTDSITVSVIMPVYNGQNTLRRAAESVMTGNYDDWELIIVNDGSTDATEEICRDLALKDSRITYYNKENGGPGDARNFGMDKVRGKYIMFLDADDEYHPDMISTMVSTAQANDAEIVMCSLRQETSTGDFSISRHNFPVGRLLNGEETAGTILRSLLTDCSGGTPWLVIKIYSTAFIREAAVKMQTWLNHGEDWIFSLELFAKRAPKFYIIDKPLYTYRYRNGSLSNSYNPLPEVNQFYAYDLSLALDDKYKLGEKEAIHRRFISESFDDALMAFVNEEKRKATKAVKSFLGHERMRRALSEARGIQLPLSIRLQCLTYRLGGVKTSILLLRLRAWLRSL